MLINLNYNYPPKNLAFSVTTNAPNQIKTKIVPNIFSAFFGAISVRVLKVYKKNSLIMCKLHCKY